MKMQVVTRVTRVEKSVMGTKADLFAAAVLPSRLSSKFNFLSRNVQSLSLFKEYTLDII